MVTFILFIAGFVLLIIGAEWLIDGAASIAKKRGISNIVIGLTIVALGTSSPELVVNLIATLQGADDVAMGNILGSNISNLLLILGISAIIYPLAVNSNTKWKEVPMAIAASIIIAILANDDWFAPGITVSQISRHNGIILIFFFLMFMYYAFTIAKIDDGHGAVQVKQYPLWKSVWMIPLGIGGMALGGKWIVDGAIEIAAMFGMSQALISLTIVAVGTSLPELATCVVAAYKKNPGIVIGNIVGSNIFNVFFIIGISAVVKPLAFNKEMNFDLLVGIFASVLLFVFLFLPRRKILERWQGGVLLALYFGYILVLVLRETGAITLGFLTYQS